MLQQTQVATVIPYYERFMQRFPELRDLAEASEDEVLAHWSGLGYYARARNLHRCAQIAVQEHQGRLPEDIDTLVEMPGIGRSTAGAILSLALGQCQPILDGNVKRVLARHRAIDGWPGKSEVLKRLWLLAEEQTPMNDTASYNQAMMDLGATVCTRSQPDCIHCPLSEDCLGLASGDPTRFPGRKPRKKTPTRQTLMLLIEKQNDAGGDSATLLERRPSSGIWGGLWSLPELGDIHQLDSWLASTGLVACSEVECVARLRHTFSHFHLDIQVMALSASVSDDSVMEQAERVWYNGGSLPGGMAAPVSRILKDRVGELF